MAFVRVESWAAPAPLPWSPSLSSWLGHRWVSRSVALVASLAVDAGVIALLLTMGWMTPMSMREPQSIATIDIASTNAQATSSSASSAVASAATAPPTKIDATTSPPIAKEWSVTTLPPVGLPKATPLPPSPPSPAPMANTGTGSTGTMTGAGYDPYAYASYRAPPSPAGAFTLQPEAIRRLEAYLRTRLAVTGLKIAAYVDVDNQGRIIRFDAARGAPAIATTLSSAALGFSLCDPDPRRPLASHIAITLDV